MKRYLYYTTVIAMLPFIAGCFRVTHWIEDSFYQGEPVTGYAKIPHHYIRSATVYDQFTTSAIFDVLWLSDEVRTAYTMTYALKNGKTDTMRKAYLRRQLEENRHFISFYVLTNNILLGEGHNKWAVFLDVNGAVYYPYEIKTIELSPEYQSFFGPRFNRFKTVWLVKFSAKDVSGAPILTNETDKLRLYFRSIKKETAMVWHLPPRKHDQSYIDQALDRKLV